MLRKFFYTLTALAFFFNLSAQSWKEHLPEKEKNKLTLYDYQTAFNKEWSGIEVKNGTYTDEKGVLRKAYGYKPFKRWEHFWSTRVNQKTGDFPFREMEEAYDIYKQQIAAKKERNNWTQSGPNYSNGGYAGIGRLNVIAFHPSDANTFWVGAPAGGLWKTETGGNDWIPLTENNEVLGVSAIAIPNDYDQSQTIYIGTGDRDGFDNHSNGVLKSTNGGNDWQATGLTYNLSDGEAINALMIHPDDDRTIFAASTAGFYKSIDGGTNWTKKTDLSFVDIERAPDNTNLYYGVTRNGEFHKSTDAGETWEGRFMSNSQRRLEIAVSADAPERIYMVAANTSNGLEGIYRSDDYGETFSLAFDELHLLNWSADGYGENKGQAYYDLALAADPNDADVLYCGGINTWKSTDGGYNWSLASHWYGGGGVQAVHADKHYLKYRPGTSDLFECNDGGIYITNDGSYWEDLSNGLIISQIYGLGTAQTAPDLTITGLQDNGTKLRNSASWFDVLGGDGMKCLIDPTDEDIQYGSLYYGRIHRTLNNWDYEDQISLNIPGGEDGGWITPFVLDPNEPEILYVGYKTLWRSHDRGDSFESVGQFGQLDNIDIAPSNSNYIYLSYDYTMKLTKNYGQTWNTGANNLSGEDDPITDICVKQNDPETLWLSLGGYNEHGVYQSEDAGETWTNISAGLPPVPVNTVIQNQLETAQVQLYAGTDFGVYIKNGDADWQLYGSDLPKVVVSELAIYYDYTTPENSRLRASTYGRGLWEADLELSGQYAPGLTTKNANLVSTNTALLGGAISENFGADISESGVIFSTEPNPYLGNTGTYTATTDPTVSIGDFSVSLSGLTSGTTYYYKAYAVSDFGTGYGEEKNFTTECDIISQIPYEQGFENNSFIPNCWSQATVVGNEWWQFESASEFGTNNGEFCAFFDENTLEPTKSMLYSPVYDFSGQDALQIQFWHVQSPLFSFQDELTVYYKNSENGDWQILATYTEAVNEWTLRTLNLPDISSYYQIAFEANSKNGKGVGIDDFSVQISTSADDNSVEQRIRLFPNPASDNFALSGISADSEFEIELYNMLGKKVMHIADARCGKLYDIGLLPAGTYSAKIIIAKQNTLHRKIVIK